MPAARRWKRVRFSIFLCFFLRIRFRRFLISDPMASGNLANPREHCETRAERAPAEGAPRLRRLTPDPQQLAISEVLGSRFKRSTKTKWYELEAGDDALSAQGVNDAVRSGLERRRGQRLLGGSWAFNGEDLCLIGSAIRSGR